MDKPADLILVGQIGQPFGVKGWLHVQSYSTQVDTLLNAGLWWLTHDEQKWYCVNVKAVKMHGSHIVAQLAQIEDRDQADLWCHAKVGVPRSNFPQAKQGEYYWVDLIGLSVENTDGKRIGVVTGLLDNGAHTILQIDRPTPAVGHSKMANRKDQPRHDLIPFVARYIVHVDLAIKKIVVDWAE